MARTRDDEGARSVEAAQTFSRVRVWEALLPLTRIPETRQGRIWKSGGLGDIEVVELAVLLSSGGDFGEPTIERDVSSMLWEVEGLKKLRVSASVS